MELKTSKKRRTRQAKSVRSAGPDSVGTGLALPPHHRWNSKPYIIRVNACTRCHHKTRSLSTSSLGHHSGSSLGHPKASPSGTPDCTTVDSLSQPRLLNRNTKRYVIKWQSVAKRPACIKCKSWKCHHHVTRSHNSAKSCTSANTNNSAGHAQENFELEGAKSANGSSHNPESADVGYSSHGDRSVSMESGNHSYSQPDTSGSHGNCGVQAKKASINESASSSGYWGKINSGEPQDSASLLSHTSFKSAVSAIKEEDTDVELRSEIPSELDSCSNSPGPDISFTINRKAKTISKEFKVSSKGGLLCLGDLGIELSIPALAIPVGEERMITLGVTWNKEDMPNLDDALTRTSPVVYCEPHGMKFDKPLTLCFPHCMTHPSRVNEAHLVCSESKVGTKNTWNKFTDHIVSKIEDVEVTDNGKKTIPANFGIITSTKCMLVTTHFTKYTSAKSSKKVVVSTFGEYMRSSGLLNITVYCINDTKDEKEALKQVIEQTGNLTRLAPDTPIELRRSKRKNKATDSGSVDDLILTMHNIRTGWTMDKEKHACSSTEEEKIDITVPFSQVWSNLRSVSSFTLTHSDTSTSTVSCKITVKQVYKKMALHNFDIVKDVNQLVVKSPSISDRGSVTQLSRSSGSASTSDEGFVNDAPSPGTSSPIYWDDPRTISRILRSVEQRTEQTRSYSPNVTRLRLKNHCKIPEALKQQLCQKLSIDEIKKLAQSNALSSNDPRASNMMDGSVEEHLEGLMTLMEARGHSVQDLIVGIEEIDRADVSDIIYYFYTNQLPMQDQFFKRNLKTHFVAVLRDLDTSHVLDYLFQEDVLDMDEYEEMQMNNKSRKEKGRQMLLHLLQCPPERTPVQALIKALLSNNTYHLATLLGWQDKKRPNTRSQSEHQSATTDSDSSIFKTPNTHNIHSARGSPSKRLFNDPDQEEPTAKQSRNTSD